MSENESITAQQSSRLSKRSTCVSAKSESVFLQLPSLLLHKTPPPLQAAHATRLNLKSAARTFQIVSSAPTATWPKCARAFRFSLNAQRRFRFVEMRANRRQSTPAHHTVTRRVAPISTPRKNCKRWLARMPCAHSAECPPRPLMRRASLHLSPSSRCWLPCANSFESSFSLS